jgi:cell shape-determining protein MreD
VAPWEASFLNLDLVIICIGYLLVRYDRTAVALFALVQGLMIDIYSAGVFGLFSFIYTGLFAGMVIGSRFLDLASLKGAVILISLAVFVKDLILIVLLNVFSYKVNPTGADFVAVVMAALVSGLASPIIHVILVRISHLLAKELGRKKDIFVGIE